MNHTDRQSHWGLIGNQIDRQSHWGLIVIDLLHGQLMFDDGYKLEPDGSVLPTMKYILNVLLQLRPDAHCFSNSFWASVNDFKRFGMPSQGDCVKQVKGLEAVVLGLYWRH